MSKQDCKYYWGIKVSEILAEDKEIYVLADSLEILDGNLIFKKKDLVIFSISKGNWNAVFAASAIDGHAYFCEHWKDNVNITTDSIELY
jgi:hypothetical protein